MTDGVPRRLEGADKVTGRVGYAGDLVRSAAGEGLDHAVAVTAPQASGVVVAIDTAAALAVAGVRLVLTQREACPARGRRPSLPVFAP